MLGVTDLKKGQVFQMDGIPYRVVEYGQKVMGRGGSIVNTASARRAVTSTFFQEAA